MGRLDNPELFELDSLNMLGTLAASAETIASARGAAAALDLPFPNSAIKNVAICGMGGSGIAGDLITSAYADRLRCPVQSLRNYYLPGWVGQDTLVILVSYSGETEETLTAAMEALDRGCLAVGITTGGKLGSWYPDRGLPVISVPPGLQPRAALLNLLVPLLELLARCEVLPDMTADLDDAERVARAAAESYGPSVPESHNGAKILAQALEGSLPVIWGAEMTAAIAQRWKGQINENAKLPAYYAALPEANHNEIVGFQQMGELGPLTSVVMLRDPRQHRQVMRRFDLTRELIEPAVGQVLSAEAEGETTLGRGLDLVLLGDYVSIYLACLRGVDSGPVELISKLKERLATSGHGRTPDPA